MSRPDPHKSKRIPIAAVKGLSKHIHGDLVRIVVAYANISQLQHECVVRSHFSDELSSYEKEVAEARKVLEDFVDNQWMPDIKNTLLGLNKSRGQVSTIPINGYTEIDKAFDVIFRFRPFKSSAEMLEKKKDILRNILYHWHSVQVSKCKFIIFSNGKCTLTYTVDIPKRLVDAHLNNLIRCSEIEY
eukprot:TRINITY_DN3856_c1_g2_i1.p1 TRINITY_DN3856_c1_g2~~TRINITY_DN3856_c1_g2_i1.p1  ORF type:complete len:187 (+),score=23.15 TRINITY_DN3856_c1_g2_i1:1169-1729(+)